LQFALTIGLVTALHFVAKLSDAEPLYMPEIGSVYLTSAVLLAAMALIFGRFEQRQHDRRTNACVARALEDASGSIVFHPTHPGYTANGVVSVIVKDCGTGSAEGTAYDPG